MSYLDTPRLAFSGRFQVDVSTINNDVRLYDIGAFKPSYQDLSTSGVDGGWNPDGTGTFRLVGCRITSAQVGSATITTPAQDPVIGMALENADDRVFGKLVDLDPQQQMVSQIWGMRLRLDDGATRALFAGDYKPAAFTNLWHRQQRAAFLDQALAATFQSVLEGVTWQETGRSQVLDALRAAAEEDCLSIALNVYGYGRDPSSPRYTFGKCAGAIGPYRTGEPKHFVRGRHLVAANKGGNPTAPVNGIYGFACKLGEDGKTLSADFGNCLPIKDGEGGLQDIGELILGVLTQEPSTILSSASADAVVVLGALGYREAGWYERTGGIQDFACPSATGVDIAERPLVLLRPATDGSFTVLVQETLGGLHLRADDFVFRLDPGESARVDLVASRYGRPIAAEIDLGVNTGPMGGSGGGPDMLDPPVAIPTIAVPTSAISYPSSIRTDVSGRAALDISTDPTGPDGTRGYIDGQMYGIGYALRDLPPGYLANFWDFVSLLVFDATPMPEVPTWYRDVQPIMRQYSNLYPIMGRRLFDLGDYDAVSEHRRILHLAFSLPTSDPNHMPVTRDLSRGKRAVILKWLDTPGWDGLPIKGNASDAPPVRPPKVAEPAAVAEAANAAVSPQQARGKTGVVVAHMARQNLGNAS